MTSPVKRLAPRVRLPSVEKDGNTMTKVVAITGASSGIGEAVALHLAAQGAKVVLAARGEDKLNALVDRITNAGGSAVAVSVDVSRRDDLAKAVYAARQHHGRLDVLVSCAGAMPIGPLDDLAVNDWDQMVDVNLARCRGDQQRNARLGAGLDPRQRMLPGLPRPGCDGEG